MGVLFYSNVSILKSAVNVNIFSKIYKKRKISIVISHYSQRVQDDLSKNTLNKNVSMRKLNTNQINLAMSTTMTATMTADTNILFQ